MTGGRGSSCAGSSGCVAQLGQRLFGLIDFVLEVDLDAQLDGQQFGHFGVDLGVDVAHRAQAQQLPQHLLGRHADRLGEAAHGAGQRRA